MLLTAHIHSSESPPPPPHEHCTSATLQGLGRGLEPGDPSPTSLPQRAVEQSDLLMQPDVCHVTAALQLGMPC